MGIIRSILRKLLPIPIRRAYHRVRLALWGLFLFPRQLFVGDTQYVVHPYHWPVALLLRTTSTEIHHGVRFFYEPTEHPYFKEIIKNKKVFFDVGACFGYYSLIAAGSGVGRVVAFEIVPEFADVAQKNFKENKIEGEVVRCAVGRGGESVHYEDVLTQGKGIALALDDYIGRTGLYPDAIKIDIEGFEYDALCGARKVLASHPTIDISIHTSFLERRGQSKQAVLNLLCNEFGYKILYEQNDTYFLQ